jgi:hypothetical protein
MRELTVLTRVLDVIELRCSVARVEKFTGIGRLDQHLFHGGLKQFVCSNMSVVNYDGGVFNSGNGRGVRGERGCDSGRGMLSIDTVADREVDGLFHLFCATGAVVRSLVTHCILHVDTGNPKDSVI